VPDYPRRTDNPQLSPAVPSEVVVEPAPAAEFYQSIGEWAQHLDSPWDYPYETAPTFSPDGSSFDKFDGWGAPRPDRYEWPPHVKFDIHFQLFDGTTVTPNTMAGWNNLLARYTIADIAADPYDGAKLKAAHNYFAHDSSRGVGHAFTRAIEVLQGNGFGHMKLTRRDKFYGVNVTTGAAGFGGSRSAGIDAAESDPRSPRYEMIATIIDERPDWYPNTTSAYELSPWWKKDHMFAGAHWDTACTAFITAVEAEGYKGRVFVDIEIMWKRRDSRGRVNSGNYWPYAPGEGGGGTVEYTVTTGGAKSTFSDPGINPIPENDDFNERRDFNE
jgi:hypothetical protein